MKSERPDLDKRKAFVLATVVYEYIATAEPVGSATLSQKYNLGVSSATIRNEMAELEAEGYLTQPHTSAGRVPSDAGYRTYVDHLMAPEPVATEDQRRIREEFRAASRELSEMIEQTTRLLGGLSKSLALAIAPSGSGQVFRHIELIWLSPETGLVVIVTSLGVATQNIFPLPAGIFAEELTRFSNLLNLRLGGKRLSEVGAALIVSAAVELQLDEALADVVVQALRNARGTDETHVTTAGARNLLDQPEFHDLRKLRSILRIIEEQRTLYDLIADSMTDEPSAQARVRIGAELGHEEIGECSLVTVPYRYGEHAAGVLAILGPRRMPYGRLMALAAGTAKSLGDHLAGVEIR